MRLWHQKPPSQSMHRSLQLGAALGILLPAVVFTSIQMLTRDEDHLESRLRAPMQQYADMLEHALATALWATDIQTTQKLVDASMDNPDVVSIIDRDEDDEIIVRNQRPAADSDTLLRETRRLYFDGEPVGRVDLSTARVVNDLWCGHATMKSATWRPHSSACVPTWQPRSRSAKSARKNSA